MYFERFSLVKMDALLEEGKNGRRLANYGSTHGVEGTVWPAMGNRTEALREPPLSASETTQLLNDGITTTCQLATTQQNID